MPDGGVAGGVEAGGAPGAGVESCGGVMTETLSMTTGCRGASDLNGPNLPVGTTPMRSTTLIPCTTLPKTA